MSDWINGDTAVLRAKRHTEWTQRAIGSGKVFAYIEKEKLNNELILNQSKEHYLSVIQIAAYFIERNIKVEVNHYDDVDVVARLPDGLSCWQITLFEVKHSSQGVGLGVSVRIRVIRAIRVLFHDYLQTPYIFNNHASCTLSAILQTYIVPASP